MFRLGQNSWHSGSSSSPDQSDPSVPSADVPHPQRQHCKLALFRVCRIDIRYWKILQCFNRVSDAVVCAEYFHLAQAHGLHPLISRKPWLKALLVSTAVSLFHSRVSKYPHFSFSHRVAIHQFPHTVSSSRSHCTSAFDNNQDMILTLLSRDLGQTIRAVGQYLGLRGLSDDRIVRFLRS
jgi:hypothetical protein